MLSEDRIDELRRIALGVTAALLLALLAWLTLSSRQSEYAKEAAQAQEVLTLSILRASQQVLGTAQDAETGERGFLLTGDPAFLQPLDAARERQPAAIARLRDLTANDPEAAAKLLGSRSSRYPAWRNSSAMLCCSAKDGSIRPRGWPIFAPPSRRWINCGPNWLRLSASSSWNCLKVASRPSTPPCWPFGGARC